MVIYIIRLHQSEHGHRSPLLGFLLGLSRIVFGLARLVSGFAGAGTAFESSVRCFEQRVLISRAKHPHEVVKIESPKHGAEKSFPFHQSHFLQNALDRIITNPLVLVVTIWRNSFTFLFPHKTPTAWCRCRRLRRELPPGSRRS